MAAVVGGTLNCEIVLDDQGFYARCFARDCRWVSERTYSKSTARQFGHDHDAGRHADVAP